MKYTDYIEINEAFQYSINLQFDINNIQKIKEYIPTSDSCEIMGYYLDSMLGQFNKATTLIGPYGKGKSHLLLVLLTLLNDYNKEDEPILEELLEKIKKINSSTYEKFKQIRSAKLKYMPVIINSNYNNINQAFLLALAEALERENIKDCAIHTYFEIALEVIKKWEEGYDEAISKFEVCLKDRNITVNELKSKLRMYEEEGYNIFKSVYSCVMHGIEFNPLINTDIVKYYKDINYSICQNGYNGMLIIFDEFSKFLEYIGNENMMRDLKVLQDFAEVASRTGKKEQIIFSCITHKTINEYIKNLREDKVNAFKTVEGRFKEIYFNRSMEQNYEIIAQTINKKENFEAMVEKQIEINQSFYKEVAENAFCRINDYETVLFKGCYPLNPITVYAVIHLSEKIAQNERTLFTFLTDDDTTSFKYFVKTNETDSLFNIDRIYDYFRNIFKKENDEVVKQTWIKSENALNKTDDATERKIIKALAVLYMINDFEMLIPNDKMLRLSIQAEQDEFASKMNHLLEKGIIKKKKTNQFYDFSTVYNKEVLKEIDKVVNTKFAIISEKDVLEKVNSLGYVIPRRYNQTYKMTRFFKMLYLTEEELLNIRSFQLLKKQFFADGIVINLLRVNKYIDKIVEKISEINDTEVLVRIPKEPIEDEFFHALKECEAIEYIRKTQDNDEVIDSELSMIEEENLEFIQNGVEKRFEKNKIENVFRGKECIKSDNLSSLVSEICEEIYNQTPIINNELINKDELSSPIYKARGIVIDVMLTNNKSLIKSPTSAEATIYKAVVEKRKNSDIVYVINRIKDFMKESEKLSRRCFEPLCEELMDKPYGIRKGIIPLLLAMAIEEYSENVILYYQNREIEIDANNISKIVEEPDKYFLYVEKGTEEKDRFVKETMKIFEVEPTDNYRINIKLLVATMKKWVLSLPRIAREISKTNQILFNTAYIEIKNELMRADINNNELLFQILPEKLKTNNYSDMIINLQKVKEVYDNYVENYKAFLICNFKEYFEHNSKTNLNTLLTNWYKNLNEDVKNTVVKLELKQIFEYIENLNTYNEQEIIQNISFILVGAYVEDWQDNTYDEFTKAFEELVNKIKEMKLTDNDQQEMVIISDGKKEIKKYINAHEITSLGGTLKNNIEDSLEEYGGSISESEKIKILLEIIRKYM